VHATWLKTGVALVLIAVGSYALYAYLKPDPLPDQILYGNGRIEGTEIRVAAEVGGRVIEDNLVEGATVEAGHVLVTLDGTELDLQKAKAEAAIEAQRAEQRKLTAELETARHHLRIAETDLARARQLEAVATASPRSREQAENAFQETKGSVAALEAAVSAAEAQIEASRSDVALIEERIGNTHVTAPASGTVMVKAVELGEVIQPGQVVAILTDLSNVELKVYVPEQDIGKVRLGAPARIAVDSFPERIFDARVASVDAQAQFTPRDIHMPSERVRTIFGVTLALDNPEGWLKPGMPADAWILWQPNADWPDRLFVPK
jgi:HlyD family secretion protein